MREGWGRCRSEREGGGSRMVEGVWRMKALVMSEWDRDMVA